MKLSKLPILLLSLLTMSAFSQEWKTPSFEDFKPHKLKGENYTEAWSYTFYLDNGTKAYVTLSKSNLPVKEKVFGGELSFYNFNGKNKSVSREYPYNRFAFKPEINGLELTSKGTRMALEGAPTAGHRVLYSTDKGKGYFLDLNFESAAQGKMLVGEDDIKGANFTQVFHIPEGRVKGRIAVGKDTLEVSGVGILEHSWQDKLPANLFAHVMQIYKPGEISGKIMLTESDFGKSVKGYAMVKKNGTWQPVKFTEWKSGDEDLKPESGLPKSMQIGLGDLKLSLERKKDQQTYSPLDNIDGWFARNAVKLALGEVKVRRGVASGFEYSLMEK